MSEVAAVLLGQTIGGRYRVETVLGQSGMTVVVAALDLQIDERVAIKVLVGAKSEMRARFSREARAAARIKGEHVGRVTDVGVLADGTPYMVMEYLDGESLATLLARRGAVPVVEALLYALQVCDALREAHALGVVHRNLTLGNLFLAKRAGSPPSLKVLDFGISRIEGGSPDAAVSAARYMAPELLKSAASVDKRADVWSLGVILYELVIGAVPFDGDTPAKLVTKVLHDAPSLRGLPAPLAALLRRCLAKAPAARYASVVDLAAALTTLSETPMEAVVRRSLSPPDTVKEPVRVLDDDEAVLADDEAVLADDDDDDGEMVDEAELLPSAPPPQAQPISFAVLPKEAPRLVMMIPDEPRVARVSEPASSPLGRLPSPPPTPASPSPTATRELPTMPPQAKALPVPMHAKALRAQALPGQSEAPNRSRLILGAIAVLIPLAVFAVGRLTKREVAAPIAASVATVTASASFDAAAEPARGVVASVESPPPPSPPPPSPPPPPALSVAAAVVPGPETPPPPPRPKLVAVALPTATEAPPPKVPATPTEAPPPKALAAAPTKPEPEDDTTVAIQAAMRHHAALRQACWDTSAKTTQVVSVSTSVDPGGAVTAANATSADASLAQCVAAQVRGWTFPPSKTGRSLQIPIRFRR